MGLIYQENKRQYSHVNFSQIAQNSLLIPFTQQTSLTAWGITSRNRCARERLLWYMYGGSTTEKSWDSNFSFVLHV